MVGPEVRVHRRYPVGGQGGGVSAPQDAQRSTPALDRGDDVVVPFAHAHPWWWRVIRRLLGITRSHR